MRGDIPGNVTDLPAMRGKTHIFKDRAEAGEVLARMLTAAPGERERIILAVPAGGVPVTAAMAMALGAPLDVAPVSKITPPGNSEVGYGAVAFDGSVRLNDSLVAALGLSEDEVRQGIEATLAKVRRRVRLFRGERPWPDLAGREAVLVDDGLASGFTVMVAATAVKRLSPAALSVAVPTAHLDALARLAGLVDLIWCANIRSADCFAVADAYRNWRDVTEDEAVRILRRALHVGRT
ncbi:MAG: phosphoribosyltransferase [Phycisphaerae bacterium]